MLKPIKLHLLAFVLTMGTAISFCMSAQGDSRPVRLGCFELTTVMNKASDEGTFFDEDGNRTKGLRKDLGELREHLELDEYKRELLRLRDEKQRAQRAKDNEKVAEIDQELEALKATRRPFLSGLNCSNFFRAVGQQLSSLLNDQIGEEWTNPNYAANEIIEIIEKNARGDWVRADKTEVQERCNAGEIVVGTFKNPGDIGHIAICAPDPSEAKRVLPLVRDGDEHLTSRLRPGTYGAIPADAAFGSNPTTWYVWKPGGFSRQLSDLRQCTQRKTETVAGNCISLRNCIVGILGRGCSCSQASATGPCDWTGPVVQAGGHCGAGQPCAQGLSCNNGRCEGPQGRCPF